jgi:hypothetical protein
LDGFLIVHIAKQSSARWPRKKGSHTIDPKIEANLRGTTRRFVKTNVVSVNNYQGCASPPLGEFC